MTEAFVFFFFLFSSLVEKPPSVFLYLVHDLIKTIVKEFELKVSFIFSFFFLALSPSIKRLSNNKAVETLSGQSRGGGQTSQGRRRKESTATDKV